MLPWLTVVTPVHEGAHFLGATLAHAAAEHPNGIEFLIYDSSENCDATRRIAESFADRLDIRWQAAPNLRSWIAKTNLGVQEARAKHVAMLHQDDLWLSGHVTAARDVITDHADAALSVSATEFVDSAGRRCGRWRLPFEPGLISHQDFISTLLVQNSIAIPTPIIRRDAWLAVGGMDQTLWYTADWDLYLKLGAEGLVVVRPSTTTAFRLHGASLTMAGSRKPRAFREQLECVLRRHINQVPASRRRHVSRRARASIEMNCALAAASGGQIRQLVRAARELLKLGPADFAKYLHQSRIIDRASPRLKLSLSGKL